MSLSTLSDESSQTQMHQTKDLLRFITCGSVDDGKSTLIGRLLYEANGLLDDQLETLTKDSKKHHASHHTLDFSLLTDGLIAEREQGITIDVAYRFFTTSKRKFIVADTPGHEQYTRNMATGASTATLAIVIVDAQKQISVQTRRHSFIVSMLGVKHIILAINKMDLVAYDETIYQTIKNDYVTYAKSLGFTSISTIPLSALQGDNVVSPSSNMPWYTDGTLLSQLEHLPLPDEHEAPFRMPVQWVNRPDAHFRGFSGRIASGTVHVGSNIKILPSGKETTIARIVTYDGELAQASTGQSVTCTLADEIDVSRGDVFVSATQPCEISSQFEVQLLWMDEKPMVVGRQYLFKSNTMTAVCTLTKIKHRIDVNTMEKLATRTLQLNEIGQCHIILDRAIAFEPYQQHRELGGFILIDKTTNLTAAGGFISFALRRASNLHEQKLLINQSMRAAIKEQRPSVLWFTGLSGSGKSTIANFVEQTLHTLGKHSMLLDGDNVRRGLNRDLDFTETGRIENIRRIAELAKLMLDAGLIVLVSCISPFKEDRDMARQLIGEAQFLEIFVDTPLHVAEQRDVKGLYKKARAHKIENFTGIGSRYEVPQTPDIHIDTTILSAEDAADKIMDVLKKKRLLTFHTPEHHHD